MICPSDCDKFCYQDKDVLSILNWFALVVGNFSQPCPSTISFVS